MWTPHLFGMLVVVVAAICLLAVFLRFVPINLLITSKAAGIDEVTPISLIGMRLRKVPQEKIVYPLIACRMAGVIVSLSQLEVQHMAGGDATRVANGLISAHRAGIPLTFETASAIDLAGRNVLEAVHLSVNPKVVELPPTTGIPQDRVSIRVTGRATLRADLDRLLTGPDESALLTLISERIGLLVNRSPNHRDLLEHPEQIAQDVMESGVDDGAAYRLDALDLAASPA